MAVALLSEHSSDHGTLSYIIMTFSQDIANLHIVLARYECWQRSTDKNTIVVQVFHFTCQLSIPSLSVCL